MSYADVRRNAAMRGRRDGGSCFQIRNVFAALETDEYLRLFLFAGLAIALWLKC